jgi:hypothetical protein
MIAIHLFVHQKPRWSVRYTLVVGVAPGVVLDLKNNTALAAQLMLISGTVVRTYMLEEEAGPQNVSINFCHEICTHTEEFRTRPKVNAHFQASTQG